MSDDTATVATPAAPKPVTDPELIKKLEASPSVVPKPVTDPDLIKKLDSAPSDASVSGVWSMPETKKTRDRIASRASNDFSQMDQGVDYSGVNAPTLRAGYGFMDTEAERTRFLQNHFGEKNVTKDSFGRDVVIMNGQKVSFLPRGGQEAGKKGSTTSQWADLASDVAPVGGMILGSLATAPLAGVGAVVGSGVGAAGARGINKLIKEVMGYNEQDSGAIAKDMALEVPKGAAAQLVGEGLGLVGRSILRGPFREGSIFGPITKRGKESFAKAQTEVAAARAEGLIPKVGTYSPNASFTQRMQNAGFRLFGDDTTIKNRPIIEKGAAKLTGGDFRNAPDAVEAANRAIEARTNQVVKTYKAVADSAKVDAETLLKGAEESITSRVGRPSGELSFHAATDIQALKTAFTSKAAEMYGPVDALAGTPVVPYSGLKGMMKQILEEMPQTAKGEPAFVSPEIKRFANEIFSLPEFGTFQQMQVARATLRDASALKALNAGLSERQAARLALAADDAFYDAQSELITKVTTEAPPQLPDFKATSLLQEIRKKGGIDIKEIRDLTGEGRVGKGIKGLPVNFFTRTGKTLDDLASELRNEGWDIPDDSVDGGVQALRDRIQKEMSGEKQFSIADTDRQTAWERENRGRESAASETQRVLETRTIIPGVDEAKTALREADKFYHEGIQKFHELSTIAMVKDASQSGFIEPENMASRLAMPGQNEKLLRVKEVVTPSTFGEIGAEKWSQMLEKSSDAMSGKVSGVKLARQLKELGPILETLYGKSEAGRMTSYAEHLAALNGDIEATSLEAGHLSDVIKDAIMKKEASDAVMSKGFVKALQTDGPQSLDAVRWLTEPSHRLTLKQTLDVFGKDSPESKNIKEYLARRIFTSMEVDAKAGAQKYGQKELMGEPLLKELDRYGPSYLSDVFGKEWTDSAYKFAHNVEVATRKNPVDSGGLIAASIGLHWIRHLGEITKYFTAGEALTRPSVITYLSKGVGKEGGLMDFLQKALGVGTKIGLAYEAEDAPKESADYVSGAVTHTQSQRSPFGNMINSTGVNP